MSELLRYEKEVTLTNEHGIHVRTAGMFVAAAEKFNAEIRVRNGMNKKEADGKSIFEMLTLNAPKGTQIRLIAQGEDAAQAVASLVGLVEKRFYESEKKKNEK